MIVKNIQFSVSGKNAKSQQTQDEQTGDQPEEVKGSND